MEIYSIFDYKKALAILESLAGSLKNNEHYKLTVSGIDYPESDDLQLFDLSKLGPAHGTSEIIRIDLFRILSASLVYTFDGNHKTMFQFKMGEASCKTEGLENFYPSDREKYSNNLLIIDNESWRKVLLSFVNKVKFIVAEKIQPEILD